MGQQFCFAACFFYSPLLSGIMNLLFFFIYVVKMHMTDFGLAGGGEERLRGGAK